MLGELQKTFEKNVCFSDSQIWDIIRNQYQAAGIHAWEGQVPYTVTNSTIAANFHAKVILQNYTKGALAIIDYGAGSAQHAFLLWKALVAESITQHRSLDQVTLYLADISQACIDNWRQCSQLSLHFKQQKMVALKLSGDWLQDIKTVCELPGDQHVLIANYLFDSMPFQAYRHHLQQGLSLIAKRKHLTPSFQGNLEDLTLRIQPLAQPSHPFPGLVERYQHLDRYTIPTMGIAFSQYFFNNTQNGIILINDKGHVHLDEIDLDDDYQFHLEGSFSQTVNFDAITQTLDVETTLFSEQYPSLRSLAYSHKPLQLPNALSASDYAALLQGLKGQAHHRSSFILTLCQVLNHDPFCLELMSQMIETHDAPNALIFEAIKKCQANTLYNRHSYQLLHLSKIMRHLSLFSDAWKYAEQYQATYGKDAAYYLETALYKYCIQDYIGAKADCEHCLLDAKTKKGAQNLLEIIEKHHHDQENK